MRPFTATRLAANARGRPARSAMSMRFQVTMVCAALVLGGCAGYRPLPLARGPSLLAAADRQAAAPWSVDDVVARVLRDNPDLVALRTQKGVARAQQLQAGLLPDPAISGAVLPLVAGVGTTMAWNAALSGDLRALVTLRARREGARAATLDVDAQVLWQEWQTAAQARLLAVQIIEGEQLAVLQRDNAGLYAERSARLQRALAQGDIPLTTAAPDLAAFQSARAQLDAAERGQLARRHQLNGLLGREPDAPLPLAGAPDIPPLDLDAVDRSAAGLALRRPDLIALRLGYRAQEARTRLAVLMQFPAFNFGATGGGDNSNVRNAGPQFSTTLPIFDRNRGDIAVQRATRDQLHAEYQARLDAAYGQLRAAVSELKASRAALAAVREDLPAARRAMERARTARDAGVLDEVAYVDLAAAYYAKAEEAATLEEAAAEQSLAIAAITGAGLSSIETLPDIAS